MLKQLINTIELFLTLIYYATVKKWFSYSFRLMQRVHAFLAKGEQLKRGEYNETFSMWCSVLTVKYGNTEGVMRFLRERAVIISQV